MSYMMFECGCVTCVKISVALVMLLKSISMLLLCVVFGILNTKVLSVNWFNCIKNDPHNYVSLLLLSL